MYLIFPLRKISKMMKNICLLPYGIFVKDLHRVRGTVTKNAFFTIHSPGVFAVVITTLLLLSGSVARADDFTSMASDKSNSTGSRTFSGGSDSDGIPDSDDNVFIRDGFTNGAFQAGNDADQEPLIQATNVSFSNVSATGMTIEWNNGGGTNRIVLVKEYNQVDDSPEDEVSYIPNTVFGTGDQIGTGNYVVYNGTSNTVSITGLTHGRTYHVAVYEFNGSGGAENYLISSPGRGSHFTPPETPVATAANNVTLTSFDAHWNSASGATGYYLDVVTEPYFNTYVPGFQNLNVGNVTTYTVSGLSSSKTYFYRVRAYNTGATSLNSNVINVTTLATEPVTQSSNVVFSNVTATGMTITWTNGSGACHLVLVKSGASVNSAPVDNNTYIASTVFGAGAQIGSGNYVVFKKGTNSVVVTGLTPNTLYYVAVFEFNGSGGKENYLITNPATGSQLTPPATPVATAATNITSSGFTANWQSVDEASGYRLDVATDNGFTNLVSGFNNLDVNNNISYNVTGLNSGTSYYYRVRACNSAGTGLNSNVINVTSLSAEPTSQASELLFSDVTANGMTITWTNGNGSRRIVLVNEANSVSSDPVDGSSYTAGTVFGNGEQIGIGNYVVYNGEGNSVTLTGLASGITYHVAVFEFNGSAGTENYMLNPLTGSDRTLANTGEYRSVASGNWNDAANWQYWNETDWVNPSSAPDASDGVITIRNGHTMTVTDDVAIDQTTINSGGQVALNPEVTLTIDNSTDAPDLIVNGILMSAGTIITTGTITFNDGAAYRHNFTTAAGTIPAATWNDGSTCEITGYTTGFSGSVGGTDQAFSTFIWNCPNQTLPISLETSAFNTANPVNFILQNTGTGTLTMNQSPVFNTFTQNGGSLIMADGATDVTVTIQGDLSVTGGTLDMGSGSVTSRILAGGDFSHTAGTIQNTLANGGIYFNGAGTQVYTSGSGTLSGAVNFQVGYDGALPTLQMGTVEAPAIISSGSTGSFTILDGAALGITSADGISSSGATGNIQVTGTRTFSSAADYIYNGTTSQTTGNGLTGANNLTISNNSGVSLSTAVNVSGILDLSGGSLTTTVTNLLTITNTATTAITGASSTNYIKGPLNLTLPENLVTGSTYTFPVGNTAYMPFALVNPVTGTGTATAMVEAVSGSTGGTYSSGLSSISTTEYWLLSTAGNFSDGSVSVTRQTAISPFDAIGGSVTPAGAYSSLEGTVGLYGVSNSSLIGNNRVFVLATVANGLGTWLGGAGETATTRSDWFNPSNWYASTIPTAQTDVKIPSATSYKPVIAGSTTAVCRNLTIHTNASLTVASDGRATMSTVTNNGTLTLSSSASSIASLELDSYVDYGTEYIELNLTGGPAAVGYTWHYISSPVSSLPVSVFSGVTRNIAQWVENLPTVNTPNSFQWGWINYQNYTYYNKQIYPNGNYGFSELTPGKGYDYYSSSGREFTFGGTINTINTVSSFPAMSYNGSSDKFSGYNLIGNPYTCGIDWDVIVNAAGYPANTLKAIYFTSNNVSYTYSGEVGVPSTASGTIPPMQGFFVRTQPGFSSGDWINIPQAARIHTATHRYKGEKSAIPLIRLSLTENEKSDETVVRFDKLAKTGLDFDFDAPRMDLSTNTASIFTIADGLDYTINGQPFPDSTVVIPVAVNILTDGNHTINVMELQGLGDYDVTLTDKLNNITINLKSTRIYNFSALAGLTQDRFVLTITNISTGIESPSVTEKPFNVYYGFDLVNIQTLADEWDGRTGSIRIVDFSGKTVRYETNAEFRKNSLIQLSSPGKSGLYFVEIKSGLMRYMGKIITR